MVMTESDHVMLNALVTVWKRSEGKSWEVANPNAKLIVWAIEKGWLGRSDGRFGYERMKDAFCVWTPEGKKFMEHASKLIMLP